jgi:hypothetical protein
MEIIVVFVLCVIWVVCAGATALAKEEAATIAKREATIAKRQAETARWRCENTRKQEKAAGIAKKKGAKILGIESGWDEKRIKHHLLQEFLKGNNRLYTLPEGTERENAQRMIDLIAEARITYG